MSRIKEFKFKWCDVFGNIENGYDSVLEISSNNTSIICMIVSMKSFEINLMDDEDDFIDNIVKVTKEWKDTYENMWACDGYKWEFLIHFDDKTIEKKGSNNYPENFIELTNYFHKKYHIPKASILKSLKR